MFKFVRQRNQIALLEAQLMRRLRLNLSVAQAKSEIERELSRDPKLRETFDRISIQIPTESARPSFKVIGLDDIEKEFIRDPQFAGLIETARKKFVSELYEVLRKLQGDSLLRNEFIAAISTLDEAPVIQDVLGALKRLGSLQRPNVPPTLALIKWTDELAVLLGRASTAASHTR